MSSTLRSVLVDIDGTLIDSNHAHTRSWIEVLARHGHESPHEAVRPLIGKGGDKLLADLFGSGADAVDVDALGKEHGALFLST